MENEIKTFIQSQYGDFYSNNSIEKKVQILSVIIDSKIDSNDQTIVNLKNSLYLDLKRFVSLYLRNKRRKDFGYEDYNKNLLLEYVKCPWLTIEQQFRLLSYTQYLLETLSYESTWLNIHYRKLQLELAKEKNIVKYILLLSSWNIWTIIISIFILYFIECLILLPAPFHFMEWYSLQKVTLSSNCFINHLVNVLSLHFSCIDNSAKVSFTAPGILALVCWNLLYIVVGVNFLFKNLLSNFDVDKLEE